MLMNGHKRTSDGSKSKLNSKSYSTPDSIIRNNANGKVFIPNPSSSGSSPRIKLEKTSLKKPLLSTLSSPSSDPKLLTNSPILKEDVDLFIVKRIFQYLDKRSMRTNGAQLNWTRELADVKDSTILAILDELIKQMEHMEKRMDPLIVQLMDGNWCSRSTTVVQRMELFIHDFLEIRPSFVGPVIHSFIKKFLSIEIVKQHEVIIESEMKIFNIAHKNLKKIVTCFPTTKDSIVNIMENFFPYMTKSPHTHYCYIRNIIKSLSYIPQAKTKILHLIINRLCRIDVYIPVRKVEEYDEKLSSQLSSNIKIKDEDGGYSIQPMEWENDEGTSDDRYEPNPIIETLDISLCLLFEVLEKQTESFNKNQEKMELANCDNNDDEKTQFLEDLMKIFEKEILPSFGLHHVQFLFFYYLKSDSNLPTLFMDFLWKIASTKSISPCMRIQAMSFVSGLLSRANYVPIKTVRRWLSRFATSANSYVQEVKDCHWSNVNIYAHGPFYAICQAIFYIFAFRNKELLIDNKHAYTKTLNLGNLITSHLNPLKACVPSIAQVFVEAAHFHQISYCNSIMERNQKATIPTLTKKEMNESEAQSALLANNLESFFPFDIYQLPRSRKWVDPLYRLYEPYLPEVKIEIKEIKEEDEDSIEVELNKSSEELKIKKKSKKSKSKTKLKKEIEEEIADYFDNFID